MYNRLNPWADAVLGQMLICQLAYDIALKTCDPQNWVNVDAIPDACLPRRDRTLNPFEFHGRRHPGSAQHSANTADQSRIRRSNRDYGQL